MPATATSSTICISIDSSSSTFCTIFMTFIYCLLQCIIYIKSLRYIRNTFILIIIVIIWAIKKIAYITLIWCCFRRTNIIAVTIINKMSTTIFFFCNLKSFFTFTVTFIRTISYSIWQIIY